MHVRVVVENSEAELAERAAMETVDYRLRALAANVLRVVRGAGRPAEIAQQAQDFINAIVGYQDVVGRDPLPLALSEVLRIKRDAEYLAKLTEDNLEEVLAEESVVHGSLQIAASQLLGQLTQQSAGSHEMFTGINRIFAQREEWRRKRRAEEIAFSKIMPEKRPRKWKRSRKSSTAD